VVVGAGATGVELTIEAATKIWAAGVEASPVGRLVAGAAGAGIDRAGRVLVRPDCTLPGHPEVFVIGDLMSLNRLPGMAQVAIQSGRHAAHTIARRLDGDDVSGRSVRDRGTMATISRFRAIASIGRARLSGFLAWVLWLAVHLLALTGFKNRAAVLFKLGDRVPRTGAAPARRHHAAGVRPPGPRGAGGRDKPRGRGVSRP
jgi:NADH dehydrogenase